MSVEIEAKTNVQLISEPGAPILRAGQKLMVEKISKEIQRAIDVGMVKLATVKKSKAKDQAKVPEEPVKTEEPEKVDEPEPEVEEPEPEEVYQPKKDKKSEKSGKKKKK